MRLMVTCFVRTTRTPLVVVGSCTPVTRASRVYSERRVKKNTLSYVYRTRVPFTKPHVENAYNNKNVFLKCCLLLSRIIPFPNKYRLLEAVNILIGTYSVYIIYVFYRHVFVLCYFLFCLTINAFARHCSLFYLNKRWCLLKIRILYLYCFGI